MYWILGFRLGCGLSQLWDAPDETKDLEFYYPTTTLVTGFDIIFFWVARMTMMAGHFTGKMPFDTVYIHGLVLDENGQKMSKSKNNGIDPLLLIGKYGTDALRYTLVKEVVGPGKIFAWSTIAKLMNRNRWKLRGISRISCGMQLGL